MDNMVKNTRIKTESKMNTNGFQNINYNMIKITT